jgi:hypothetical protein
MAFNYSAKADITTQEARDANYIRNHGHSEEMSRLIDLQRQQITGESVAKSSTHFYMWPVKFYKKVMSYLDPIYDNGNFGNHEIHPNASSEDL